MGVSVRRRVGRGGVVDEGSPAAILRPIGGFLAMCLDTFRFMFRRPFQFREFVQQVNFIAGVSLFPSILVTIPLSGIGIFVLGQLLVEIGAVDLAGAGAMVGVVREFGPIASVLVVAGAGATAICADLGARTIREETDAMRVMGINLTHRLVVPRVLASALVALLINGVTTVVGLALCYLLSIGLFHASAGQFVNSMTLLAGQADFYLGELKAAIYGLCAGLVACYRGLTVGGGSKGVGEAVNQTVILSFILLFLFNTLLSVLFSQAGLV
ncbi:MAG: ABC transporter permease [Pseudonocardia sp.]|nr:ABC transporter permease [Pseudonocardia sp.]